MIQIIEYLNENYKFMMRSSNNTDLQSVDEDQRKSVKNKPNFEPTPYTFAKIENGKKITANSTSLTPPSWLLLDHSIAIIWLMFSASPKSHQLSIEDFKWAYEFLKQIKNRKGDNPPDVKLCLREIQDQLIHLYAKLTSPKKEDFDELAAAFGDKIIEDTNIEYSNKTFASNEVEPKMSKMSLAPSKTPPSPLTHKDSVKDVSRKGSSKKVAANFPNKFPVVEEDSDPGGGTDTGEEEEIEKYLLSLFARQTQGPVQAKQNTRSLIPTKKKKGPGTVSEVVSRQDGVIEATKKEITSKRVHCVAEMRSLRFRKSTKVHEPNGEEAAYSNLKAEIKRLSFNPNVSRNEILRFLKDWRSEQIDRLNNELKRLSSIEEFMKTIIEEGAEPNLQVNPRLKLKDLDETKTDFYLRKSLIP